MLWVTSCSKLWCNMTKFVFFECKACSRACKPSDPENCTLFSGTYLLRPYAKTSSPAGGMGGGLGEKMAQLICKKRDVYAIFTGQD